MGQRKPSSVFLVPVFQDFVLSCLVCQLFTEPAFLALAIVARAITTSLCFFPPIVVGNAVALEEIRDLVGSPILDCLFLRAPARGTENVPRAVETRHVSRLAAAEGAIAASTIRVDVKH